jgi:hypothetical protein
MSLLDTASLIVTPNGYKAGTLYSVIPNTTLGDLSVTRATTATRVNSSGLIESVASNVPRLDYTNGSCPSVLVEPQRTNLSRFVESGTGSFNEATVTAGTSILGLTTFKVTTNVTLFGDAPSIELNTQYQANTTYTLSFYTDFSKTNDTSIACSFLAFFPTLAYAGIRINTTTKAITTFNVGGIWTLNSYEAKQISGEIYRIIITATPNATGAGASRNYINAETNGTYGEFAGVQLEAGSYDTSFINKASSASVTRNADQVNKTGISSLIGQTEGTIFFNGILNNCEKSYANILNGERNNNASFSIIYVKSTNSLQAFILSNGMASGYIAAGYFLPGQRVKIAYSYKSGSSVLYLNGNQIGTSSQTFTLPNTIDDLYINDSVTYSGHQESVSNYVTALWKTKLTTAQLAQLTTL